MVDNNASERKSIMTTYSALLATVARIADAAIEWEMHDLGWLPVAGGSWLAGVGIFLSGGLLLRSRASSTT